MKHSTEYIYGDLGEYYIDMQKELAEHKLHCCDREIREITNAPTNERDAERYAVIKKAQDFNEKLLKEFCL